MYTSKVLNAGSFQCGISISTQGCKYLLKTVFRSCLPHQNTVLNVKYSVIELDSLWLVTDWRSTRFHSWQQTQHDDRHEQKYLMREKKTKLLSVSIRSHKTLRYQCHFRTNTVGPHILYWHDVYHLWHNEYRSPACFQVSLNYYVFHWHQAATF